MLQSQFSWTRTDTTLNLVFLSITGIIRGCQGEETSQVTQIHRSTFLGLKTYLLQGKQTSPPSATFIVIFLCLGAWRNLAHPLVNPTGALMAFPLVSEGIWSPGRSFFIHFSICLTLHFLLRYFTFPESACICNVNNKCLGYALGFFFVVQHPHRHWMHRACNAPWGL